VHLNLSFFFQKQLRGSLFFGSSLRILDEVKQVLNGTHTMPSPHPESPQKKKRKNNRGGADGDDEEEVLQNENVKQEGSLSFLTKWFYGSSSASNNNNDLNAAVIELSASPTSNYRSPSDELVQSPNQLIKHEGGGGSGGGTWNASAKKAGLLSKSPGGAAFGSGGSFVPNRTSRSSSMTSNMSKSPGSGSFVRSRATTNANNSSGSGFTSGGGGGGSREVLSNAAMFSTSWDGSRHSRADVIKTLRNHGDYQPVAEGENEDLLVSSSPAIGENYGYGSVASYFMPPSQSDRNELISADELSRYLHYTH
jgi:hypothetical protein